ncbi:hypothetical protein INT45_010532 [Circinella minor]|uniref:Chromo domain-containing protein n=1 Tax=Circinella minor TaxID=1195481 RepID=A0A8H7VIV2_9FUNG|nr:hypothetical protein INT45_010532 [Circinella minor]
MSTFESNMDNSTSEEEEYEVERILDHRRRNGKLQYEIKWKDYSEEDNTWENETNVFAIDLINTYWDSRGGQEALKAARSGKKVKKVNSPGIKDKGKQSGRASSSSAAAGVKRTRTPDISLSSSSGTSERLLKQARTEDNEKENEDKINTSSITTDQQQQQQQQEESTIEYYTSLSPSPLSSLSPSLSLGSSPPPPQQQQQQQQQQQNTFTTLSSSSLQQHPTTESLPSSPTSEDNQQNLQLLTSSKQKDSIVSNSSQAGTEDIHKENDNEVIQHPESYNNDELSVTTTTEKETEVADKGDETITPSLLENTIVNKKDTFSPTSPSLSLNNSFDTINVSVTGEQEPTTLESFTSQNASEQQQQQPINNNVEKENIATTTITTNDENEMMDELDEPTSVISPGTLQDAGMMLDIMDEDPFTPTPPPADKPSITITTDNSTDITTNHTANEEQQAVSIATETEVPRTTVKSSSISKEKGIGESRKMIRDMGKQPSENGEIEQDPVTSKFTRREKYMKGMEEINEDDVIYDDNFPAHQDDWVNVKEVVAVTQVPHGSPDSEVFAVVRWYIV